MDILLFSVMLFSFQFLYWVIGHRASRNLHSPKDYFLAGKSVAFFPLMMTFLATQIGGGFVLGSAEAASHYGWPVFLYPFGAALGLMVLGSGVGSRLAHFKASSIAQVFEIAYQSRMLRKCVALISIISLFMILVVQIIASSKFLNSLGFANIPLFIFFWIVVILYTMQGGLKAVISTDLLQAAFFFIVFIISMVTAIIYEPAIMKLKLPQQRDFANVSSQMWGWLLMPFLYMVLNQDMAQRCFAGASSKIVSRAAFSAGMIMLFICFVPIFFGCLAATLNLQGTPDSSILMIVIEKTTTPWLTSMVGCAVLAAIISSSSALINAIGSNLSNDFNLAIFRGCRAMTVVKTSTCFLSSLAILCSFYLENIVSVLIQTYELSVSCIFVSLFFALLKENATYFLQYFRWD